MDPDLLLLFVFKFSFIGYFACVGEVTDESAVEFILISTVLFGCFISPFFISETVDRDYFVFVLFTSDSCYFAIFRVLVVVVLCLEFFQEG